MVSAQSLWKRIESAFRGPGSGLPALDGHAPLKVVSGEPPAANPPAAPAFRLPWGRTARAELEQRYQRVALVMESLERHFDRQDERAAQLVGAVERVARSLNDLTDQQRRHHDTLAAINQQLTLTAKHAGNCAAAFVELPAAMQAQADSVRTIGRQMESVRGTQAELGSTLGSFRGSIEALRETGITQVECLERLHLESYDDRRALQHLIRTQQQRFLVVLGGIAAVAIGAMLAAAALVASAAR